MYAEELIYSYEHQKNRGTIPDPSIKMHEENISCGDAITVYMRIVDGKVADVKYDGVGCVISMGTSGILTDFLKGKGINEIEAFDRKKLLDLISIDPGPVRMHCATLSLRAIKKAIYQYDNKPADAETNTL